MCRKLTRKNLLVAIFLCAGMLMFLAPASQAIEGKAGEVIKTVQDLQDLKAKGLLCEGFFRDWKELIDNNYTVPIVETTDWARCHSPAYLKVSEANRGKAKLGPKGELENYEGGRPFMDLKKDDPQLGVKLMWNYWWHYASDAFPTEWNYYLTDAKGNVKRLWGVADNCQYNFRTDVEPKPMFDPKSPEVKNKFFITFLGPFESKGLSQIRVAYIDSSRKVDAWVYVPGLRRATRSGAAAGCDALGGFVSVADDDYGFSGNIIDFDWKYIGEKEMLVPTLHPTPPADPWPIPKGLHAPLAKLEKRKMLIVEGIPRDPNYCYSKRRIYMEADTFIIINSENFNQAGELWKNYWEGFAVIENEPAVGGAALSVATGGCTDYFIGEGGPLTIMAAESNKRYKPADFTIDAMRRRGR